MWGVVPGSPEEHCFIPQPLAGVQRGRMTSGQSSGHSSPGGDYETPDTQLVLSPQAPPRTYKGLGAGCGVHLPYRPGVGGKSCRRVDPAAPTAPAAATAASAAAPPVPARPSPRPRPRPAHANAGRRMEPRRARWVPAPLLCLGEYPAPSRRGRRDCAAPGQLSFDKYRAFHQTQVYSVSNDVSR